MNSCEQPMSKCGDLEPLLAAYVEGQAPPQDSGVVDAHLASCPPCRDRVAGERAAREVLLARRQDLKTSASEDLKRRCAAHRVETSRPSRVSPLARRTWLPVSMAATVVLAAAAVFLFGLADGVEALAAQLAVDHVKCFQFPPTERTADPAALGRQWSEARGWPIKVPASEPAQELELLGLRRCASTEGLTAHMMYRWRGQPFSVYVLNSADTGAEDRGRFVETMGQETVVWSRNGRTYAVVARGEPSQLEQIAQYVKLAAE